MTGSSEQKRTIRIITTGGAATLKLTPRNEFIPYRSEST